LREAMVFPFGLLHQQSMDVAWNVCDSNDWHCLPLHPSRGRSHT
jgi:hypothetical protein